MAAVRRPPCVLDPREAGADVRLVRRLVLGEARVAVDPEGRPRRIRLERDAPRREPGGERLDQGDQRLLEEPLELRLARLEPGAVVVGGQVGQELDGLRPEAGEGRRSERSWLTSWARSPSRSVQPSVTVRRRGLTVATAASSAAPVGDQSPSSSSVTTNGGPRRIWSPSTPFGVAGAGVEQHAARAGLGEDRLGQSGGPREGRAGLAVGHELDALEQPATADLADVGVVAEAGLEQPSQPCALGGARLDQRLRLEDAQDLAGDGGADDMVRVGEAVGEAAALERGRRPRRWRPRSRTASSRWWRPWPRPGCRAGRRSGPCRTRCRSARSRS